MRSANFSIQKVQHAFSMLIMLLAILLSQHSIANTEQPSVRVEPPNWWAGMHSDQLQLMLNGQGIGNATRVSVEGDGLSVASWRAGDSSNYLFIDLNLASDLAPGSRTVTLWRGDKILQQFTYDFFTRAKNSALREGFAPKDVIYLITPDRFANGDLNNDAVAQLSEGVDRSQPGTRHGGDLQGVRDHLDYIADMGFTQIWLNPVLENAQDEYSYHGYSTTDFYRIDPRMGDNELYFSLSQEAAAHSIGIIMDVVLNHAGSGHWWMQDLPFKDWINFGGEFSPTSHRREALRDPHAAQTDIAQFSDGWFVPTMPDLNQRNAFMATYLIQNAIWWVESAGLSGLRVDTYSYSDPEFITHWSRRLREEYPNLSIVGEEWSENPAVVAYWQENANNADGYQSFAPNMFDFPWQVNMVKALNNPEKWGSGMVQLYESVSNDFIYADPYRLVIFPDNHDMSRIFTQLQEDSALWRMAMVLTLTMRGIPQIYYGTELLMTNPGTDDHGVIRKDFPGGWPTDAQNGFTGRGLTKAQSDAQSFLRELLNWRKTSQPVKSGKLMHYAPEQGVYVYFRYLAEEAVMVVVNHNEEHVTLYPSRFKERLKNVSRVKNVFTRSQVSVKDALTPNPMSATVYEFSYP